MYIFFLQTTLPANGKYMKVVLICDFLQSKINLNHKFTAGIHISLIFWYSVIFSVSYIVHELNHWLVATSAIFSHLSQNKRIGLPHLISDESTRRRQTVVRNSLTLELPRNPKRRGNYEFNYFL